MKIYMHNNSTNGKEYALRLISHLCREWMVATPSEADVVGVSLCDITEIGDIATARKYGKPVLVGGMIADYPMVNELADYVWHGEIYGLARNLVNGQQLVEMDSISTKKKRELLIDELILWEDNPIIRVGQRARYYYTSKGCPVKCKFCYMANSRSYQKVPESLYNAAVVSAGKNIMPIAAYNPYRMPRGANIGETRLKDYAAGKLGCDNPRMIRAGVECVDPGLSKDLAKSVSYDDLCAALERAAAEKTKLILYYLAGLEPMEQIADYLDRLPVDYRTTPVVNLVWTYIDPQPFTPFNDFDLRRKITDIDHRKLYRVANGRNKRVRVIPVAKPGHSTIRTLYGRCTNRSEYDLVRKAKSWDHEKIIDFLVANAPHLIGNTTLDEIRSRPRRKVTPSYWEAVA